MALSPAMLASHSVRSARLPMILKSSPLRSITAVPVSRPMPVSTRGEPFTSASSLNAWIASAMASAALAAYCASYSRAVG